MGARFPAHRESLDQLALEEHRHAEGIARLCALLNAKAAPFAPQASAREGLASLQRLMAHITSALAQPETTYQQALQLALSFEMSLLERGFFRLMRESLPTETTLLDRLNRETQDHFQNLLQQLRAASPGS